MFSALPRIAPLRTTRLAERGAARFASTTSGEAPLTLRTADAPLTPWIADDVALRPAGASFGASARIAFFGAGGVDTGAVAT
jgi:hypothetical protein